METVTRCGGATHPFGMICTAVPTTAMTSNAATASHSGSWPAPTRSPTVNITRSAGSGMGCPPSPGGVPDHTGGGRYGAGSRGPLSCGKRLDKIGPVVIFRDARREDLPAIVALLADDLLGAGREGPMDEAYQVAFDRIMADPGSRLIVADADGQVAGILQLNVLPGLSRHGMLRAQIEGVRVAAAQHGQGLGKTMIAWAIGQARELGCGLVQLTSDKRRPDAIRFYESLGFAATHEGLKLSL